MPRRTHNWSFGVLVCTTLVLCTTASAHGTTFKFNFWPTPGAEKDPRFLARHEGPCGDVVEAAVSKMPSPRSGDVLGTDIVYELSGGNRIVNTWHLPVDALPVATAGRELVFRYNARHYAVTTAGSIRQLSQLPRLANETEVKCKMPAALRRSGYARCAAFPRLGKVSRSVLAYQGPCT
jgi:hypothetical protein